MRLKVNSRVVSLSINTSLKPEACRPDFGGGVFASKSFADIADLPQVLIFDLRHDDIDIPDIDRIVLHVAAVDRGGGSPGPHIQWFRFGAIGIVEEQRSFGFV